VIDGHLILSHIEQVELNWVPSKFYVITQSQCSTYMPESEFPAHTRLLPKLAN
jgi:hypothetical protein